MRRTRSYLPLIGVILVLLSACHARDRVAQKELQNLVDRYQICLQRLEEGSLTRPQALQTLQTVQEQAAAFSQPEARILQAHLLLLADDADGAARVLERCTPTTESTIRARDLLIQELTLRRQEAPDLSGWLTTRPHVDPQTARFALSWLERPLPLDQKADLLHMLSAPELREALPDIHQKYLLHLAPRLALALGKLPGAQEMNLLPQTLAEALPSFWQQNANLPEMDWISPPPPPQTRPRVLLILHPRQESLPPHLPADPHLWILTRRMDPQNRDQNLQGRVPTQTPCAWVRRGTLMDRWGIQLTPTWIRLDGEGRVQALWQGALAQTDLNLWLAPPPAPTTTNTPKETNHG